MAVTGEQYVERIDAVEPNRRARAAFRDLVLAHASRGASIFDFGAGPGSDALFYAQHGFNVGAYDADPEMRKSFTARCAEEIARGRVRLLDGTFERFLATPAEFSNGIDLVTANFAPLSMIDNLPALFARFFELTRPGGKVIASVLNPYSMHDMRYKWWWSNQPRFWRDGSYAIAGPGYRIHRRSVKTLAREAAPYFSVLQTQPGVPLQGVWRLPGLRSLTLVTGWFMFVVFARRGARA